MLPKHRIGKIFLQISFLCFVCVGTYNAVVINTQSEISGQDMRFVKRLDEVYGVITPGRMLAASTTWKKLSPVEYKKDPIVQVVQRIDSSISKVESETETESESGVEAAIKEELNLTLTEVMNPRKWQGPLPSSDFAGNLSTRDGIIESLNISVGEESISISFSEMKGNVFEYAMNGETYTGMIYQVDKQAYIITLTNGPLENTRLTFSEIPDVVPQEIVGGEEVVASNFEEGVPPASEYAPQDISNYDVGIQEEVNQSQAYHF